ncbi:MAG: GIY-YIG nuclease family protein [Muribaculaceae bacterium]|nr:GIY-YIG nuclease family protein [Muribaculaceae bacterium]
MNKWDSMLLEVIKDPIFANIKPAQPRPTSNDRLIKSFNEITDFVEQNGRLPDKNGSFAEKSLLKRLEGIIADESKREKCRPYDTLNLLDVVIEKTTDEQLAEILNDPIFNVSAEASSLFDIPTYMKEAEERAKAEYIAKRKKCKNFDEYEPMFQNVHRKLKDGSCKLVKFKEAHMAEGTFFVVGGVLTYLDKVHALKKDSNHKIDGRTRCIYENGTESDILIRTLGKSIYIDGYTVQFLDEDINEYVQKKFTVGDLDVCSGSIYVLRSKSDDEQISSIKNLYKIGFTRKSVEERIANAKNEATYLYADVEIVAEWQVYNIKAVELENALHKLFGNVQLGLSAGNYVPKEWYVVPYHIIEEGITRLINGERIKYDAQLQAIITE